MLYTNIINMQGLNLTGLKHLSGVKKDVKSFLQEIKSIDKINPSVENKTKSGRNFSVEIKSSDQFLENLRGRTSVNDAGFISAVNKLSDEKIIAFSRKNNEVSVVDESSVKKITSDDKISLDAAIQLLQLAGLFKSGDQLTVRGSQLEKIFNLTKEVQKRPAATAMTVSVEKNSKENTVVTAKPLYENAKLNSAQVKPLINSAAGSSPVQRDRSEVSDSDIRLLYKLVTAVVKENQDAVQISKLADTVCFSDEKNNQSKLFGNSKLIDRLIVKVGEVFRGKADSEELGLLIKTTVGIANRICELQSKPKLAGLSLTFKDEDVIVARKITSSKAVSFVRQEVDIDMVKGNEGLPGELQFIQSAKHESEKAELNSFLEPGSEQIIDQIYQEMNFDGIYKAQSSSSDSVLNQLLQVRSEKRNNTGKNIANQLKQPILKPQISDSILQNGREFYFVTENTYSVKNENLSATDLIQLKKEVIKKNDFSEIGTGIRHLIRDETELRSISAITREKLLSTAEIEKEHLSGQDVILDLDKSNLNKIIANTDLKPDIKTAFLQSKGILTKTNFSNADKVSQVKNPSSLKDPISSLKPEMVDSIEPVKENVTPFTTMKGIELRGDEFKIASNQAKPVRDAKHKSLESLPLNNNDEKSQLLEKPVSVSKPVKGNTTKVPDYTVRSADIKEAVSKREAVEKNVAPFTAMKGIELSGDEFKIASNQTGVMPKSKQTIIESLSYADKDKETSLYSKVSFNDLHENGSKNIEREQSVVISNRVESLGMGEELTTKPTDGKSFKHEEALSDIVPIKTNSLADQLLAYIDRNKKINDGGSKSGIEQVGQSDHFTVKEINNTNFSYILNSSADGSFIKGNQNDQERWVLTKRMIAAVCKSILNSYTSNDDGNRILLQLNPNNLGRIKIDITKNEKAVDIKIEFSETKTMKLMESEKENLADAVRESGLNLDSLVLEDSSNYSDDDYVDREKGKNGQQDREKSGDESSGQRKNSSEDKAKSYQFSFAFINLLEDNNEKSKDLIGVLK